MNYLNFQQLQKKLGNRSRSAIYEDLRHGRLPTPFKIGRRCYWSEGCIDRHLQDIIERSSNA